MNTDLCMYIHRRMYMCSMYVCIHVYVYAIRIPMLSFFRQAPSAGGYERKAMRHLIYLHRIA